MRLIVLNDLFEGIITKHTININQLGGRYFIDAIIEI
jgi:hypothetical protein